MKGRCSALLMLFLTATEWASLAAGRPDGSRPPLNLQVDLVFQPVIERMWQASPTFRRQCRRLAAEPSLQVKVTREDQPRSSFADARTALTFQGNVPVTAHVELKSFSNAAELIAHEFEHILEQLDRVDFAAQAGNGAVWRSDRTSFETRRAIETGRRVSREMTGGVSETEKSSVLGSLEALKMLKQQDRDATPLSLRTSRVSGDGRYVVFISSAGLAEQDRNQLRDVYVTDLATGRTTLESVTPDGVPGDGQSHRADISSNGRYVVFESEAGNLTRTPFATGTAQIFLRDRVEQTTRLLTTNAAGEPAQGASWNPVISGNGTAVAFESGATDLLPPAGARRPAAVGIYLMSLTTGVRSRLDVTSADRPDAIGSSMSPAISADGRYVVFASKADLTCQDRPGCPAETPDRNRLADVYVLDTQADTTIRVSRSVAGGDPDGPSYDPAISGDGRVVAFVSEASNLTRDSNGRAAQIYEQDLASGRTELVSRAVSARPANGSSVHPALSFDGSTIAFQSLATNLVCEAKCPSPLGDINLLWDVFVHDRHSQQTTRMSADGADEWMENSRGPALDDAGRVLAFGSRHPIDADDVTHDEDLYVVRIAPARQVSASARIR